MERENSGLERELRIAIKTELQNCSPSVTPKFCDLINTKDGYLKAEDMIINYAIRNQVSISAAIAHLEVELG